MFNFSVVFHGLFSLCFTIVQLITVPATGLIDYFGHPRGVQAILLCKERFDNASALQHDLQLSAQG